MSTAANRIRCVLQRVHSAELLIDNKEEWKQIGFGVVVYVCFLKDCTSVEVEKAAKALFSVKIFKSAKDPLDGPVTSLSIPKLAENEPFNIMIVPQASMGGKIKGSTVQYHANVNRDEGKKLYDEFVSQCSTLGQLANKESLQVVSGTYGNRQGLKLDAELGPFSHIIEF